MKKNTNFNSVANLYCKFAIAFFLSFMLLGCESKQKDSSPIKIEVIQEYDNALNSYYPVIKIISIVDDLIVKNVLINKGNCKFSKVLYGYKRGRVVSIKLFPSKLKYGQTLKINIPRCNNVLRIDTETNKGDWVTTFE